jgi:ribosomal protein L11 methyltransferase
MNYVEVSFLLDPILPAREVLMAELAELGFESFVESEEGLTAYIQQPEWNESLLEGLMTSAIPELKISWDVKTIEATNWNAEWEKSFDPISVDDECLIRAPFHEVDGNYKYVITIEPKMSFGTGHHATTHLIISEMLQMEWKDLDVLDMGSGTAVLAILAEKMGARDIDAIDIDEWAFENAEENAKRNECSKIRCLLGGAELLGDKKYDVILANINRNILLRDMHLYRNVLKDGGKILFSGFYEQDVMELEKVATPLGLKIQNRRLRNEWCMLSTSL